MFNVGKAARRDVQSNILHCVFPDSISLLCYSAAHWEPSSEDCVPEKPAAFLLDAGLMDDLRGSSG